MQKEKEKKKSRQPFHDFRRNRQLKIKRGKKNSKILTAFFKKRTARFQSFFVIK